MHHLHILLPAISSPGGKVNKTEIVRYHYILTQSIPEYKYTIEQYLNIFSIALLVNRP